MIWNETTYPPEMAHLEPGTRSRAAKLANALAEEGYPEPEAIQMAIRRMTAERDADSSARTGAEEIVVPHERGWAVASPDGRHRTRVYATREEAIKVARELAEQKKM